MAFNSADGRREAMISGLRMLAFLLETDPDLPAPDSAVAYFFPVVYDDMADDERRAVVADFAPPFDFQVTDCPTGYLGATELDAVQVRVFAPTVAQSAKKKAERESTSL